MLTFAQFLAAAAENGELVNTLFEERLFELVGVLHRITAVLSAEHISHELIGGLAVLVHVEEANPELSMLTRDVDLLVNRMDLERIKVAAAKSGFRLGHAAGRDMLLYGATESGRHAVHLIFSGEKVRQNQVMLNPPIEPDVKQIYGEEVMVIALADLIRMKLTSYRLKDQVHVKAMDAAGLITAEIESTLSPELVVRLKHVRETE
jgi:hypothetical protein